MALSSVVSGIFNVENIVTSKSGLEVTQSHRKWYRSIDWIVFYRNFVPIRLTVYEIFHFEML